MTESNDRATFTPPIEFLLVETSDYRGQRPNHLGLHEPDEAFRVRAQLVDGELRVQVHEIEGAQMAPGGSSLMSACMHAARRFVERPGGLSLDTNAIRRISAVIVPTEDTPAAGLAPTLADS